MLTDREYRNSFTFIEILVVVTIIGLLTAAGSVSYSQFVKQSRDAKRKADIEQIRAAVEMYRSNNGTYPNTTDVTDHFTFTNCTSPGSVYDASSTYLSKASNDPKCANDTLRYYYNSTDGISYTIGTKLEIPSTSSCGDCETTVGTQACNYCMGPYGQL